MEHPKQKVRKNYLDKEAVIEYQREMYNQYHEDGTLYPSTFDILKKWGFIEIPEKQEKRLYQTAKERRKHKYPLITPSHSSCLYDFKKLALAYHFDTMKLKEKR